MSLLVCFLIPAIFLLLGLALAGSFAYREIPRLVEETARGDIQKGFPAELPEPGKYTLWMVTKEALKRSEQEEFHLPPGGKIHVFDAKSGREIPLSNWVTANRVAGGELSVSLGEFSVTHPKTKVTVKGSGVRMPITVSVTPSNMGRTLRVVMTLLVIVLSSLSVAVFFFIALLHRRQKMVERQSSI